MLAYAVWYTDTFLLTQGTRRYQNGEIEWQELHIRARV